MIIFLIGRSGSGKDLFFKQTLQNHELKPIILHTTRPQRPGEIDGQDYYFISMDQMNELDYQNMLVERREYNTVHGIWSYATCAQNLDLEKNNYLTINTWKGYQKFLDYYKTPSLLVPFYLQVDEGILFERALHRERATSKDYEEMCRRFLSDAKMYTQEKLEKYNPVIINNDCAVNVTQDNIDQNIRKLLR